MFAWLLRLLVLALLGLAASWWWWSMHLGWSLGARVGVAMLILVPHAPILAAEFVLLAAFGDPRPAPKPGLVALIHAWAGEVWWGLCTFGWRQAFRVGAEPDLLKVAGPPRRGVLLVHGFVCNRAIWNPWLVRLRAHGIPFVAVNLEPVFGAIDAYAEPIEAAVRRLEEATGVPPLIVCHSMGGLAARAWLQRFGGPRRCAGIVTIGTPHHGTWLARFAFSRNGRQMQRGSRWLGLLNHSPDHAPDSADSSGVPFDCYYGHCDNIVFPAATATLPGARNVHVPGAAHIHMLGSPQLFLDVLMKLGVAQPAPHTPSS